jgi:hypothetical protein
MWTRGKRDYFGWLRVGEMICAGGQRLKMYTRNQRPETVT